jgi:hypothetical protein
MFILLVEGPEKTFAMLSSAAFHFLERASRGEVVTNGILDKEIQTDQFTVRVI